MMTENIKKETFVTLSNIELLNLYNECTSLLYGEKIESSDNFKNVYHSSNYPSMYSFILGVIDECAKRFKDLMNSNTIEED